MSNYFKLLKIFLKTTEITSDEKKRSKRFYQIWGTIIVLLVMIPAGLLVGLITYALSLAVLQNGGSTEAANIVLHIIAILSVIFGFNVIVNIFYFSNDIQNIIPLPLKPQEIVASKFTYALLSENIMEFILTIGVMLGFMFAGGFSVMGVISTIISLLTIPILPLSYCGIAALLFMFFAHKVKNREFLNKVSGVGTALLIVGSLFALLGVSDLNSDTIANSLVGGENKFLNIMNCIFPQIPLLMRSIADNSVIYLLYYLLVNFVVVAIFLLLASKMYLKGASDVNSSGSKKSVKLTKAAVENSTEQNIFKSYLKKELKILFRTPPFFMDCILINLLWPVFIAAVIMLQGQTNFLSGIITPYINGDLDAMVYVTLMVIGASVLVTAINSLASTAITREGKHFEFMRYIPVPLDLQLNVKILTSIIISSVGMLIYVIAFYTYCGFYSGQFNTTIFVLMPIIHLILAIICVTFVSYLGVYMDSINPKLVWDDEINALRGNYNVVINTAVLMITIAVIIGLTLLCVKVFKINQIAIIVGLAVIMITLTLIAKKICKTEAVKNLEKIE